MQLESSELNVKFLEVNFSAILLLDYTVMKPNVFVTIYIIMIWFAVVNG